MAKNKLKVLFISGELIAGDLAYCLKNEGCDVRMFIKEKELRDCFDGMIEKTSDWKKDLSWVGKDGLIVFDDVGDGKMQDKLRRDGYLVVGSGSLGERLEADRVYGQKIMQSCGVISSDFLTKKFTIDSALKYVKKHRGEWVVKQSDHNTALNYVGSMKDGSDVVGVLENYRINFGGACDVYLQKKVSGVEIAIGRFFNGKKWIGPSVINVEHKHLENDDIGPLGGETGTLMWYESNDNNKIYQRTLAKMESHLREIEYKGYIDINCIISGKDNLYPLEITSRFGSSTVETQSEIQTSPWKEILLSIARGEDYDLKYNKGFGLNVALTVPPFPYRTLDKNIISRGVNIFFKEKMTSDDISHIHFENVLLKKIKGKDHYFTAGVLGYTFYITANDRTINGARKKVYNIINKIIIPKMFYRTDIGLRFAKKDRILLKNWGWIS